MVTARNHTGHDHVFIRTILIVCYVWQLCGLKSCILKCEYEYKVQNEKKLERNTKMVDNLHCNDCFFTSETQNVAKQ